MALRKASDLFVECLEAEGVKHVFGIPGEETLDLNESLSESSIQFVPVRHEQGGAYMADVYGRLTGRAGVCLGTLGPGATNLMTAVADAYLDRAPLVALTGQGDLERMHKESHQYIDTVRVMRPITKWNAQLSDPNIIPEVVRKAFKVAESEKPGATHIELPEDVMAGDMENLEPLPRRKPVQPEPAARELLKAADLVRGALNPVALVGNGVTRGGAAPALREFVRATGIPVAETFMGKGALDTGDPQCLGSVGLQSGDYRMAGFEVADLVIAIGYDLVEHAPKHWNRARDKTIICVDTLPAAIAAKLVHPNRKVVSVNGDGGFLMNCQELETAVRLKTPFVTVIWENHQYGSIVWKQEKKFGRHFGTDFTNPDFVKLAESFGMAAWRIGSVDEFGERLRHALELDLPSLIVLPIDYSIDVAISEELGAETVAT